MNERIRELLAEVGLFCYDDGTVSLLGETQVGQPEIEKFAELIVKECVSIVEAQKESLCDNENDWSDRDYGYEQAVIDSVDMIQKHFGVEE